VLEVDYPAISLLFGNNRSNSDHANEKVML